MNSVLPNRHIVLVAIVGTWTSFASAQENCSSWSVVPSPNPGAGNTLSAVEALSPTDVWAVGSSDTGSLAVHWDGTMWRHVPTPPLPVEGQTLLGLSQIPRTNRLWAVGASRDSSTGLHTLTLRWNGSRWMHIPSPSTGDGYNSLSDVAAVSARDAWAVGTRVHAGVQSTLILRWNGTAWIEVSAPSPGSANNSLTSVIAIAADDVWATGSYRDLGGSNTPLLLHWDGVEWTMVPGPMDQPEGSVLFATAAHRPDNVWAMGVASNALGVASLAMQWNGLAWNVAPAPIASIGAGISTFTSVSRVPNTSQFWIAGARWVDSIAATPVAALWNGSRWQTTSVPSTGAAVNSLEGVAAAAPDDVWAVGSQRATATDPFSRTLIVRCR